MPTRRIGDLEEPCRHPQHDPPGHMVWKPGVYQHVCPGCRAQQTFTVTRPTLGLGADLHGDLHGDSAAPRRS